MSSNHNCPYCQNPAMAASDMGTRRRKVTEQLVRCTGCNGYSIRTANGLVWPLSDRTNPDADVGQKVID